MKIFLYSIFYSNVDARPNKTMELGRSGQPDERDFMGDIMKNDFLLEPLSKPKRCGKVEINEDSTAGKISTKNPYPMNTRCTWKIDSSCSALKWRFTSFSIEDDTDTYENDYYYEQYYENQGDSDNVKWWMCSFDHVQVFYGDKSTGEKTPRLCQWDTDREPGHPGEEFISGEFEDYVYVDNGKHAGNPRSLGYLLWNRVSYPTMEINFLSDEQIHSSGFSLEWACDEELEDRCTNPQLNAGVLAAIDKAFETDLPRYTKQHLHKGAVKRKINKTARSRMKKWAVRVKAVFAAHGSRAAKETENNRECLKDFANPLKSLVGQNCDLNITDVDSLCQNLGDYFDHIYGDCKKNQKLLRLGRKCANIKRVIEITETSNARKVQKMLSEL